MVEELLADVPDVGVVVHGVIAEEQGIHKQVHGHEQEGQDTERRQHVGGPRRHIAGPVARGDQSPPRGRHGSEVDEHVLQPRARPEDGHRHEEVVRYAVAQAGQNDRHFHCLAVLVAAVVLKGGQQRAHPKCPEPGLDIVIAVARPEGRPQRHEPVAKPLVARVEGQVATGDDRIEPALHQPGNQRLNFGRFMLTVRVNGEDNVVGADFPQRHAPADFS